MSVLVIDCLVILVVAAAVVTTLSVAIVEIEMAVGTGLAVLPAVNTGNVE